MKQISEKEGLLLIDSISQLNPIEFIGLATLLGVPCYDDLEHTQAREAEELLSDILDEYIKMNRVKRRKLLRNIKDLGSKK